MNKEDLKQAIDQINSWDLSFVNKARVARLIDENDENSPVGLYDEFDNLLLMMPQEDYFEIKKNLR